MITPINHLRFVKSFLKKRNITERDSIIDVGCGLGGMLICFSSFPFGMVAGLEYSNEIGNQAQKNVTNANRNIRIIIADAIAYSDYDMFNFFYLFNPFDEVIIEAFIKNLNISLKRNPRRITLIYVNSLHKRLFTEHGYCTVDYYKKSMTHKSETIIFEKDGN